MGYLRSYLNRIMICCTGIVQLLYKCNAAIQGGCLMKPCAFCQAPLEDTLRFCWRCGKEQAASAIPTIVSPGTPGMQCPACGQMLVVGARFCAFCGQPISQPQTQSNIIVVPSGSVSGEQGGLPGASAIP